jgi:glycosyltransferase involved in cell wall biosynthesis
MPNKVAFFTVFYPEVEPYLEDFLTSLQRQTFKDFTLVIFNDGLEIEKLDNYGLDFRVFDASGTPAKIRETGISYLREHDYDFIIFGDSDDFFAENRIEVSLDKLRAFDIVVNDLSLVDASGATFESGYFSARMTNNTQIWFEQIREKNIFGLSNTGVRRDVLEEVIFDDSLIAVDWYFFSMLLLQQKKAVFSNDTTSFYRQHQKNTAGFLHLTENKVLKSFEVKTRHYRGLSTVDPRFQKMAVDFEQAWKRVRDNPDFLIDYCRKIDQYLNPKPFWWEEARIEELFYEN